jgi:ribosomal small subunit protein bTHX
MGKGDKKTRRGKLFQGSFGVRRPKNKPVAAPVAVKSTKEKEVKEIKEVKEVKEVKATVPEVKAPKAAAPEVKAPKAAPAKKEAKPKKSEEAAS